MAGRPLDPRNDASQTATRVLAKEHSTNFGLKVFKDAYWLVTPEDGDRYPVGPPYIILFQCSTAVVQLTVNQLVVGSIPATGAKFALLVKWYNIGFVIRGWQFDSVTGHHYTVHTLP